MKKKITPTKKTIVKTTTLLSHKTQTSSAHKIKIERGAKDFAKRFEHVMHELANG